MPTRREMIQNMQLTPLTASEGLSQPPAFDPNWTSRFTREELRQYPEILKNYFPSIKPLEDAVKAVKDYRSDQLNIHQNYRLITLDEKRTEYVKILKDFDQSLAARVRAGNIKTRSKG